MCALASLAGDWAGVMESSDGDGEDSWRMSALPPNYYVSALAPPEGGALQLLVAARSHYFNASAGWYLAARGGRGRLHAKARSTVSTAPCSGCASTPCSRRGDRGAHGAAVRPPPRGNFQEA